MLHRIIDFSAASALFTTQGIEELLAVSRRNNAAMDITGLMLYHDGSFFQVLEGPPEPTRALFGRICADRRHRGMITMMSGAAAARAFPHWKMGFGQADVLSAESQESVVSLKALAKNSDVAAQDRVVSTLMRSFLTGFREFQA